MLRHGGVYTHKGSPGFIMHNYTVLTGAANHFSWWKERMAVQEGEPQLLWASKLRAVRRILTVMVITAALGTEAFGVNHPDPWP